MTRGPQDRPLLLALLQNNPILWKLIATWPNVERPEGWNAGGHANARQELYDRWAALSGVSRWDVRAAWKILFKNGILREDGTVDPAAEQYAYLAMVDEMPPELKRRTLARIQERERSAAAPNERRAQEGNG